MKTDRLDIDLEFFYSEDECSGFMIGNHSSIRRWFSGGDYIPIEILDRPDLLLETSARFEIVLNGFYCILSHTGESHLSHYIWFLYSNLCHFLIRLQKSTKELFPEVGEEQGGPGRLGAVVDVLCSEDHTRVSVEDIAHDSIALSYLPRDMNNNDVFARYFSDVVVPKQLWIRAQIKMLEAFFAMQQRCCELSVAEHAETDEWLDRWDTLKSVSAVAELLSSE